MGELTRCLNCDGDLQGPFCASCGQRAVPPDPTVRELAGEAWNELTGYDGRIMATIRGLMRPGFLTRQYMNGRRANYLPPLRVYLIVSVLYFLLAASAPEIGDQGQIGNVGGPGGMRIGVTRTGEKGPFSAGELAELRAQVDTAPWYLRPMIRSVVDDPNGFRARMFTIMPRVFFALLPVFAGLVALFYRRRHFPTALVFAVHLHAFAFVIFTVSEALKFTRNEWITDGVGLVMALIFVIYAVTSFRAVFGGSWLVTIAKAFGVGFLYLIVSIPAFIVIFLWASWT
ncbi:MAG TPA: DUF3667 domain-containing protein [Vicinamibacterales bacterium]|nr:DUF3667 domain-containing protein [Vicinamibacterales bacterium]